LVREILKSRNADFKGADHQIDTYFNVSQGRLKLIKKEKYISLIISNFTLTELNIWEFLLRLRQ